ncbi:TatD family hydrolase [Clostridium sp. BJN0001]|uniref:amidohydrolase family protein n=1 Tax=Clostridium sp. BJN0001 TaxID=2930219 RepID=UPI001FD2C53A|nr:TatD family hydrolase [Clostridium sp. BJN0001]
MIIDTHTHIGTIAKFNMPKDMLIKSMDKYNIDYALISNIEGAEFDEYQKPIPKEFQHSQKEINESAIEFARQYKDRIGVCMWTKPSTEGCTEEFENMIIENRDIVYGIKFHPYHSKIAFDSPKVEEYMYLAEKYNLPVVVHTDKGPHASPYKVYKMALKHPNIKFVMVHMGLETDNEEAIDLISKLPNLYGDTTWVKPENALKMIKKCGIDKLLFGTDSPIDGEDTYANKYYQSYFNDFKNELSAEDYDKLMYKNAIKLFNLPIVDKDV